MRPWLNLKDLFSFSPPSFDNLPTLLTEIYKDVLFDTSSSANKAQLENIKFDNSMRIAISLMALITSLMLWAGGIIPSIIPVVATFCAYAGLQIGGAWLLTITRRYRAINFGLCSVDLIALSMGVYWTGAGQSPLYFIYFMPLIIQAFHRDWALLVYYGAGGMALYAIAIAVAIPVWTSQIAMALGMRILFMSCTVGIALLAVNLLRRKEEREKRRMSRLNCLVYLSQLLNGVNLLKELPAVVEDFVKVLNLELEKPHGGWARIFLVQSADPLMKVAQDPSHPIPELKQSISAHACPAVHGNRPFHVRNADTDTACPVESFSMFKSHICIPISGELNESFGVIFAASPHVDAFKEDDLQFLNFIGRSLGLTVQRLKRMEELNMAFSMDSCAMATFVGSTRTLEDTYAAIVDGIRTILNADSVAFLLWEPIKRTLETKWVVGIAERELRSRSYQMGEGIAGQVLESGKPYWTYELDGNPLYRDDLPFKGVLCVPLQSLKGEPLGVVVASLVDSQRTFSVEEIDLVSTFCTRAAVAFENAVMHLRERKVTSSLREQWASAEDKAA